MSFEFESYGDRVFLKNFVRCRVIFSCQGVQHTTSIVRVKYCIEVRHPWTAKKPSIIVIMVLVVRPVFQTPAEGVGFGASFTPAKGTDCKYDPTVTLPFPTQAHAKKKKELRSYRRPLGKRQQVAADKKSVLKVSENAKENIEAPKRKCARDERTLESLVDQRVTSTSDCSIDTQRSQSEDSEASVDETSGDKLRKAVGDMSLTLFSPAFFRVCARNLYLDHDDAIYELDLVTEEVSALMTQDDPVNLKPEPMSTLTACPRILTANMIHQLIEEALPMSLRTARWDRIYALGRDGDEFITMTRNCANFKDTVILAVTSQGHIVGGYASAPWAKQEGHRMSRSFYGNGESFLFASHPEEEGQHGHPAEEYQQYRKYILNFQNPEAQMTLGPENEEKNKLHIFKWTGSNTYSQYVDDGQLAMGGGGAFGLIIQDNFSRGSTCRCSTFGNPPLVPRGIFDIVNFEVYGFTSLGRTLKSEEQE
jgi:hypothetical protein